MSVPSGTPGERKTCGLFCLSMATLRNYNHGKADCYFIIFTSTHYACLLIGMLLEYVDFDVWRAGFFQLFHLMFCRAAVAPDCTLGSTVVQSALP